MISPELNHLEPDTHMAMAALSPRATPRTVAPDGSIGRKPHQPHFQAITTTR